MHNGQIRRAAILIATTLFLASQAAAADPWKSTQLIEPEALAKELAKPHTLKPLILQVGFEMLYNEARIPGAKYCGPANDTAGIAKLKECVAKVPRTRAILIYCGCCPWSHCPNLRPAFSTLAAMGFRRVQVLNIPNNFGQDWVARNFPTEKGQ